MSRPLILFYLLVLYVLFQFSWWAYLLMDLNQEIYQYRLELLKYTHAGQDISQHEKILYAETLQKKWAMILGEGAVFLSLLVFGIYKTRKAISREFQLARQQKNFLLSVTHEFKSPLAAVKLNLQTLLKRELDRSKHDELLNRALTETERINILVENALMAARLENKSYELYNESIDFSAFAKEIFNAYQNRQDRKHLLSADIEDGIKIKGDKLAIHSMIDNLLENAEKYSPEESNVKLKLVRSGQEALLAVYDEGGGIPAHEKHRIFDKFYRVGNEDTRKTKGTGLGLYIVSTITQMHQGRIQIRNNEPQGSVFEIYLPLSQ
jgi:two-component system, OmpR family, phosphate regulon sensor histidine kinase PhoR